MSREDGQDQEPGGHDLGLAMVSTYENLVTGDSVTVSVV